MRNKKEKDISYNIMQIPLMPKATAMWLIENTSLTFEQIAEFCQLHVLEIQSMADGEVARGIQGLDPMDSGQLTRSEITRCEEDSNARLRLSPHAVRLMHEQEKHSKRAKYTPISRRQDKPDAIAWLLKHCPEMTETQITKLIGTTKTTIKSIKEKTHWNISQIRSRDPVLLGLCSQTELDRVYAAAKSKAAKEKLETEE